MNNFESLDLFLPLQRALAEQNYSSPTPIQAETIPAAIEGADILGCAKTGTGKTAAFALPILDFLGHEQPPVRPNRPTVLVLAPTRELAIQIADCFDKYGKYMKFRKALVYGGVGQSSQVEALRKGVDVLIATPGRLLDLMGQRHINLSSIEILVLDEADRMLDMGFLPALKKIVAALPRDRQSLFFSATLPPNIRALAAQLLFNPVVVTVKSNTSETGRIAQSVRFVNREDKLTQLRNVLTGEGVDQAIVFTRTKHGANGLAQKLERAGIAASAIHGNKSQSARQNTLLAFRQLRIRVLVATDIAARGIDVEGITHVVNYDVPDEPESYIHRIGRTGRAGADGVALTFCMADEMDQLRAIERLAGNKLQIENPEFKFTTSVSPTRKVATRPASRSDNPSSSRSGPQRSRSARAPYARSSRTARPPRSRSNQTSIVE